jgi:hypothetical protein
VYIVVIAWLYVALMMGVAEANHPQGSVFGAVVTFVLYGAGPVALVVYLLGHGSRRRARRAREAALSAAPDRGSEAATDPVPPVGKEP